ncbi:unnamed protein product [Amoebophrya sp. A25]|nr:unnamed protein product [Amoebophrya sp. A25]|eukprot:GSA25T00022547001.1
MMTSTTVRASFCPRAPPVLSPTFATVLTSLSGSSPSSSSSSPLRCGSCRSFVSVSDIRRGKGVTGAPGEHCYGGNRDTLFHYKRVRLNNSHLLPLSKMPENARASVFDTRAGVSSTYCAEHQKTVEFTKYPGVVANLGAQYYFREGQKCEEIRYYRHAPTSKVQDTVFVGSVDERKRQGRTVENYLQEKTRGFAVQIIMCGRGVKLYWNPKYPQLAGRKGVSDKQRNLTRFCKLDREVKIHLSKIGNLATVSGPTKAQVGNVAMRLFWKLKCGVYTGKGAKIAFNWIKRKVKNKK